MPDLGQDVNQNGQSLPPVASPSSQDTDNTNIATQTDQGGVINTDQNQDDGFYKNKWVEADRKNQILEGKLQMVEGVISKFQAPTYSQSLSQLQQTNQAEPNIDQAQQDLELLRITEADLQEIEQSPEGKREAARLRSERLSAYRRKVSREHAETENRVYERVKREQNIQKVLSECPELDNPSSSQNQAFMAEYSRMEADGRITANTVLDAFMLAKAKNPNVFSSANPLRSTPQTRRDALVDHSVGSVSPANQAAEQKDLIGERGAYITENFFGHDVKAINERVKGFKQQTGGRK